MKYPIGIQDFRKLREGGFVSQVVQWLLLD